MSGLFRRWVFWLAIVRAFFVPGSVQAEDWEELFTEEEITVWQREVKGTSFVEFRGKGRVDAPMQKIMAVLRDHRRKTEWMHQCAANFAVEYQSTGRLVVYNRTASPFFMISDRDVVLAVKATPQLEKKTMRLDFTNRDHPKVPQIDGVVRMPRLIGFWEIRWLATGKTEITYQVQADPGGSLPSWLVNLVSKKIPWHTLVNLRRQAKKGGYEDEENIVAASFDWSTLEGTITATPTPSKASD